MAIDVGRQAARRALQFRLQNRVPLDGPCDVFELIHASHLVLRFMDARSLEGLYLQEGPSYTVAVSALRPRGLQRFTAAHELGHHLFHHGERIDRKADFQERFSSVPTDERLADMFARFLLMPKRAVFSGFDKMGSDPSDPSDEDIFHVSSWLGVGYSTLLHQMHWTLGLLKAQQFHNLLTRRPATVKRRLVPAQTWIPRRELFALTPGWANQRVHAQVGDVITGIQDPGTGYLRRDGSVWIADRPGEVTCRLDTLSEEPVRVSIARSDFVGVYTYRYLEEESE